MSQLEVDKIIPQSGTTLTIGDSGDTITFGTGTTPQLGGDLDLNSNDITGTGNINITGTATVSGDLTVDTDTLYVDSANNRVGIGTSSPNTPLEINTTSTGDALRIDTTTATTNAISGNALAIFTRTSGTAAAGLGTKISFITENSNGIAYSTADIGAATESASAADKDGYLFFSTAKDSTNATERMRITSSGNVGIGTSSPSSTLEIKAADNTDTTFTITGGTAAGLGSNAKIKLVPDGTAGVGVINSEGSDGSDVLAFQTNGSERMRINSSGNVGIGDSNPNARLFVNVATNANLAVQNTGGALQLQGINDAKNAFTSIDIAGNPIKFSPNASEAMRIDSSGNVLIGTTSTTINTSNFGIVFAQSGFTKLSHNVNGANTVIDTFGNAGQFRAMGDGDAENTNNSYGGISDRTLKENETPANSQWNDIKALQIKNYNFIKYPDRPHIGVIAQDLESAGMNGLVKTDNEGLKSVKYSVLYMKAVKALQEALIEIDNLKARVDTLEGN